MDFLRSGLRPSLRKSKVLYHKVTAILILFQLAIAICEIKITNISQNIGIPIKVISRDSDNCEVVLPYTPLASKDVLEKEILVRSDELYGDNVHIAVVYKDTFENMYELIIEFIQSEKYELSNTQVLSDKLI